MNAEVLKKQHYWIIAGIAPLLALIAFILIITGVGGTISEKAKAISGEYDTVSKTRPKGTKAFDDFDKQKQTLAVKREELWKKNYDEQKKLFTWPGNNESLKALEKKYTKFGEPITFTTAESNEFGIFKRSNIYLAAYQDLSDSMRPVRFQGGWQSVLRHVSDWGTRNPDFKQVWLALEDLWVQRGLLQPILAVNSNAASFDLLPDPQTGKEPKDPLNRSFASKLWRLDMQVTENGPNKSRVIETKLTNLTDRLLPLGSGGAMRLKVWLGNPETEQPIEYRIQGLFVRGNGVVEIRSTFPDATNDPARTKAKKEGEIVEVKVNPTLHGIPVTSSVEKIAKVEQILDERTVPIQRVENIELGYKDARHAVGTMVGPTWWPAPEPAAGAAGATDGMPGGPGPGREGAGGPGGPGVAGMGGAGMGGMAGGTRAKRGGPMAVLDGNRERYLTVTGQVRRMPVAVVLLVDQMYVQETLIAYSNAALRFQITQVHWNRFRRTLGPDSGSGSDVGVGGPGMGGPGMPGMGGPGMPGMGGPGMPGMGGPGMPGMGGMGGGRDEGEGSFGSGMPGMGGFGGFGANSTATEGQLTAGLVELTIYGIITLYEKYENKVEGSTDTASAPMPDAATIPAAPMIPAAPTNPAVPGNTPAAPANPAVPGNTPAAPANPAAPTNPAVPGNTEPKKN